jgi:hypothetical protein
MEELTLATFAPTVGDAYEIDGGEAGKLELELVDASEAADANAPRPPFVLTFRGPAEPVLAQQIVPLEHQALGVLEIFLVPIGRDEDGTTYEAVFS